jgi:hypothetical protein
MSYTAEINNLLLLNYALSKKTRHDRHTQATSIQQLTILGIINKQDETQPSVSGYVEAKNPLASFATV